jgi:ATP-dependent exoDNAse (exonuclease V) beta subunit
VKSQVFPMKFLVYKASAGSGKTYTLVKEYLKMALADENDPLAFRRILAITFTNKAASEMKERVIHVLHGLALINENETGSIAALADELCISLEIDKMGLRKRCQTCLSSILHNYGDFSIGTIDSFMHRVVRTFAFDLHLPINFNVELDQEVVLRMAIDQVMERIGTDASITKIMLGYTEYRTDDEKSMRIEDDLFATAGDLLREQQALIIKKLQHLQIEDFLTIRTELLKFNELVEKRLRTIGFDAMQIIRNAGLQTDSFFQGKSGIGNYFYKLSNFTRGSEYSFNSYHAKALEQDQWYSKTANPEIRASIDAISADLGDLLNQAHSYWTENGSNYILNTEIIKSIYSVALLNEISKSIDKIRDDEFIVHISEFNRRVSEIVFNEPAPFIFERLGEKYQHYLIDEFQDTSVLQWQNLLPLIHNGLANNNASMIVGDGKQAIYRFRGGEVEQFAQIPEPYPEILSPHQHERYVLLKHFYNPQTLGTNWRSLPEVIQFNNDFYDFISKAILPQAFTNVYEDHQQKEATGKTGGFVKFIFSPEDADKEDRTDFQLESCLKLIRELMDEKGYQARDIALLTRKNSQGTLLASYLIQEGIPVISGESLLVKNAPEVRMLLAWMNILIHQQVDIHLFQVCNLLLEQGKLPQFRTIHEMLLACPMRELEVFQLLKSINCAPNLDYLRAISLIEACFELCRLFDFDIQHNTYLHFFLEAVWGAAKNHSPDIPQFLEYWEDKQDKLSIALPQDADAVRIMTVHKSKGLQFPVVIIPFAYGEKSKSRSQWVDDPERLPSSLDAMKLPISKRLLQTTFSDLVTAEEDRTELDSINLLYVATTRPEDALYIISGRSGIKGSLQNGWESYIEKYVTTKFGSGFINELTQFGDADFKNQAKKKESNDSQSVVHSYSSGNWQSRIRISRRAILNWEFDSGPNAMQKGKLVHRLLSEIKSESDIERALNSLLDEGAITLNEQVELNDLAQKVLNHPQLKLIYADANKLISEKELLLPDGSTIRPDRVIISDNEVVVIDYKTGIPSEQHEVQIQKYMKWLREIESKSCRGLLVYLQKEIDIKEVS